jgi:ankyrin repeat protein
MSASQRIIKKNVGSEPLNGDSVLHKCARANSASGIEGAASTSPMNGKNNRQETALIVAAQNSACRAMAALIRRGAEVDHQDINGNTALHYSILTVSEKAVEILSTAAADFNIPNADGQSAIHLLALSNNVKLAKLVCRKLPLLKMDVIDQNGYNPFIAAVVHGSLRMVDYFLNVGYDPTTRTRLNKTPLHIAIELNNFAMIKLLAKTPNINNIDDNGHSALTIAVGRGIETAVDVLLQQDADISQLDKTGNSMLHIACTGKSANILRHMFEHFSDLNIRNSSGETPLHLACALNKTAVVSELCARRANITAQDNSKRTPLMTAIMSGSQRSALVLLEWEFVRETNLIELSDENDMNALQYCILFNDQSTAARIRAVELALLDAQHATPTTQTLYLNTGDTSPPIYITADPLEIIEDE